MQKNCKAFVNKLQRIQVARNEVHVDLMYIVAIADLNVIKYGGFRTIINVGQICSKCVNGLNEVCLNLQGNQRNAKVITSIWIMPNSNTEKCLTSKTQKHFSIVISLGYNQAQCYLSRTLQSFQNFRELHKQFVTEYISW